MVKSRFPNVLGRTLRSLCGVLVVLALSGCGGGKDEYAYRKNLVPYSGTITMGGKPLNGAEIVFLPEANDGQIARGLSDADGKYELYSFPKSAPDLKNQFKGALPGNYRVVFSRELLPDGTAPSKTAEPTVSGAVNTIPPAYQRPGLLKATIGANGGTQDFSIPAK